MRFSVVIPCYNGADHLGAALDSVAAQSLQPCEVLVVDDASTDASASVALARGATVLHAAVNRGAAAARNLGIAQATGDAVAFIDADDLWRPEHLAGLGAAFGAAPAAGVAFGGVEDTQGRAIATPTRWREGAALDLRWDLLAANPLAQSGTAVRTPALREVGGYDARVRHAEDYDLWLRLVRRTRFTCRHATTVTYRRHEGQVSRDLPAMCGGMWAARARALDALAAEGSAVDLERARTVLLATWEAELAERWRAGATDELDALLAQHARVPGSQATYRRWRRWRTWAWSGYLRTRDYARRLPEPWVNWLRRLRPPSTAGAVRGRE